MAHDEHLRSLFAAELPRLYAFAYQVAGERETAYDFLLHLARELRDSGLDGEGAPRDVLVGMLARSLEKNLGRKADQTFKILDSILRSDVTRPVDMEAEGIDGDPDRIPVFLWELKRTCLTAVLGCLPPSVRLSFILTDLLGYAPAQAAILLGIRESAFRVRLTRARKRIEDYLTPRCQHVDSGNACSCEGRLGIALEAHFVVAPPHTLDIPDTPHDADPDYRDMATLYGRLPPVVLEREDIDGVLAAFDQEPASRRAQGL